VFVQTAIKGVSGIDQQTARGVLAGGGLQCNWWRNVHTISPAEINERLSPENLDLHVNAYGDAHPQFGGTVSEETAFISLTAGSVERSTFYKTNFVRPAHQIALDFATDFGQLRGDCFLFYCWVVVGLRPAVEVTGLSEEIRELNTYRRYSAFQTEGEIAAKIQVPSRQIHRFEMYRADSAPGGAMKLTFVDHELNPDFIDPQTVVNIREAF
jgi:hypothetical protein